MPTDFASWILPPVRLAARVLNAIFPGPDDHGAPRRLPHSRPREECPFPIQGGPYYLAGLTIGGPVSDHGSHAGVKAAVRPMTRDGVRATGRDLLEVAHYAAFGPISSRIDRTRVRLDGLPLSRTEIEFRPWGWIEHLEGPGATAEARVATIALDCFIMLARVKNHGPSTVRFRPRLEVLREGDPADESMQPMRLSLRSSTRAHRDASGGAVLRFRRKSGPSPLDFDDTTLFRAIRAIGEPLLHAPRDFAGERMLAAFGLAERTLAPRATTEIGFLIGCGESEREAHASIARGFERLAVESSPLPDASRIFDEIDADWTTFLAAIPLPEGASADLRRVVDLSATALRMNVFAPRGTMRGRSIMAGKVHFNAFYGWDTPICALGARELDPKLAKETLATLLEAQRPDGQLIYAVGPRGEPVVPVAAAYSQPPVVFAAVEEVFRKDGGKDVAWLGAMYARLSRFLGWWDRERRDAGTGLYCYRNALESGWDDTPRIPNPRVEPIHALGLHLANLSGLAFAGHIANADLNGWMFLAFEVMAKIARRLGRETEASRFDARARTLADAVEKHLWDEEHGAYFDRDLRPISGAAAGASPGKPIRVLTPAIAWPLFVGLTRDRARVKRVVAHLLDPQKFWGDPDDAAAPAFPIPSVAFNDPAYSRHEDGYYWRGQIWLIPCFAVLVGLFRYGFEAEAATLRARLLRLLAGACEGGLFETYDARTGEIGFGSGALSGPGEPACFQIGLTTAVALEIALGRHERRREVARDEAGFTGYVEWARSLEDGRDLYRVIDPVDEAPRATLKIEPDGAILVTLDDPARTFGREEATIEVRGERRVVRLGEVAWF